MNKNFEVPNGVKYTFEFSDYLPQVSGGELMSSGRDFQEGDVVTVVSKMTIKSDSYKCVEGYVVRDETNNTGDYFFAGSLEATLEKNLSLAEIILCFVSGLRS